MITKIETNLLSNISFLCSKIRVVSKIVLQITVPQEGLGWGYWPIFEQGIP